MRIDTPAEGIPPAAAEPSPDRGDPTSAGDPITQAYLVAVHRLEGFCDVDAESTDGFLTAVACAPEPIPLAAAMVELVGDAYERCFSDPADRADADAAFGRYHARIVAQLDPEGLEAERSDAGLQPYMYGLDEGMRSEARAEGISDAELRMLYDGASWASGFAAGFEFASERVTTTLPPRIALAMRDCAALIDGLGMGDSGPAWQAYVKRWWKGRKPSRDELIDAALGAVEDLRVLWLEAALTPEPLSSDKVGRNDPCPCGSGKKFKKCHGA